MWNHGDLGTRIGALVGRIRQITVCVLDEISGGSNIWKPSVSRGVECNVRGLTGGMADRTKHFYNNRVRRFHGNT